MSASNIEHRTSNSVRTRFAPSPTGFLHIGGVRTALFNFLYAKQQKGSFVLRLEDTDRERFVPEGVAQIVEGLDWLDLKPDEGFWISEGKHQSTDYIQSERQKTGLYRKYATRLIEKGLAYYSPTSPDRLENLRQEAKKNKSAFLYRKHLDDQNTTKELVDTPIRLDIEAFAQQMKIETKNIKKRNDKLYITWSEPTRETVGFFGSDIDDFILIKADGFPVYNFANVIDDHEMQISYVLRGNEFLSSTPKHIVLYNALGINEIPEFVHLPLINSPDGKKLSKRTGDTNVLDYRHKGYLPEALLNFLVLLGWNDGTEQEIFSLEDLIQKFSLQRINTSPAVFDLRRLDWMNGHYIRELSIDELHEKTGEFWPKEAKGTSEVYKKAVLGLVQERLKYLAELPQLTRFFFSEPKADQVLQLYKKPVDKQLQKNPPDYKNFLEAVIEGLSGSGFLTEDIQARLNKLLESLNTKPAVLFPVIRIAVTGSAVSPEIFGTLATLGKEKALERLQKARDAL